MDSLSSLLSKQLSISEKKSDGIYFTPKELVNSNLDKVFKFKKIFKNVLEPSCGSCEFVDAITKRIKTKITAIEINKIIYENIKPLKFQGSKVSIINDDFLSIKLVNKFDLIIGNPPYFVMKKNKVPRELLHLSSGRPNIFAIFITKSLELLEIGGILSFILPINFINSNYYLLLRKEINKKFKILCIEKCETSFIDTKQETISFIIQNDIGDNTDYILEIEDNLVFNTKENINILKQLLENSTSLNKLKYNVKIGNITWNEHKNKLRDTGNTRLIYSSDISDDNTMINPKSKNKDKKKYIDLQGISEMVLVVNRGYGTGKYIFKYSITDCTCLIENHLLVITGCNLQLIINSFKDPRTMKFIDIYFGNGSISSNEMKNFFPIYIN